MATLRRVLLAVRLSMALGLVTLGIVLVVKMFGIQIEEGAILFVPMLLAAALMCFGGAIALLVPRRQRGGLGSGSLGAMAQLFNPF
jgi:flagellar biosynthesis protein FliQ